MTRCAEVDARRHSILWLSLLGALGAVACGDDSAPPPPPLDGAADGALDARRDADVPRDVSLRRDAAVLGDADITLILPYFADPQEVELDVAASPGQLDVHFSVDTTSSFGEEIDNIQAQLDQIVEQVRARVEDAAFGVSRFEDFPTRPFGSSDDRPFTLLTAITTSTPRLRSAVASLDSPLGSGGDFPESGFVALAQIARGDGLSPVVRAFPGAAPGGGTIGGVGFREDSLRAVVHITDATSHVPADYAASYPGTASLDDVVDAMNEIDARVIGIASAETARGQLEQVAVRTGAVTAGDEGCPTGVDGAERETRGGLCPLVYDVSPGGFGLSNTIVDAITGLLDTFSYDSVFAEHDDRLGFVSDIVASRSEVTRGEEPSREDRRLPEDSLDTFVDVPPSARLFFRLIARNTSVRPADYEQSFRFVVSIVGDDAVLSTVTVRVIVPAGRVRSDAGAMDADTSDGMEGGVADASLDAMPDAMPDAMADATLDGVPDAADATAVDAMDADAPDADVDAMDGSDGAADADASDG